MKVSSHCQKKLESIAKMPVPQNAKQVKQFWEVLMLVDSEVAVWVSGAAETVDYFG